MDKSIDQLKGQQKWGIRWSLSRRVRTLQVLKAGNVDVGVQAQEGVNRDQL